MGTEVIMNGLPALIMKELAVGPRMRIENVDEGDRNNCEPYNAVYKDETREENRTSHFFAMRRDDEFINLTNSKEHDIHSNYFPRDREQAKRDNRLSKKISLCNGNTQIVQLTGSVKVVNIGNISRDSDRALVRITHAIVRRM
jgi:hypothetical protein